MYLVAKYLSLGQTPTTKWSSDLFSAQYWLGTHCPFRNPYLQHCLLLYHGFKNKIIFCEYHKSMYTDVQTAFNWTESSQFISHFSFKRQNIWPSVQCSRSHDDFQRSWTKKTGQKLANFCSGGEKIGTIGEYSVGFNI